MLYRVQLPMSRIELATLVVIGTYCKGSGNSNYHTITITTAPHHIVEISNECRIYVPCWQI
jgi:hypothetical protein